MNKDGFLILLIFFFCGTLVLGFVAFPQGKASAGSRTVLLNPKHQQTISRISVFDGSKNLILEKKENFWLGTLENTDLRFPADQRVISDFFAVLTGQRLVYKLTDNPRQWNSYGLGESQGVALVLEDSGDKIREDFFFGAENYTGQSIYLRTGKNTCVYQTKNDLFSFLTAEPKMWADMSVFFQRNPALKPEDIFRVIIETPEKSSIKTDTVDTHEEFAAFTRTLLSARGGAIVALPEKLPETFAARLVMETLSGEQQQVLIYSVGETYVAVADTFSCGLEISVWTYNRLLGQN